AQGLGREVGEELAGPVDLALALGERLALLARQELAELGRRYRAALRRRGGRARAGMTTARRP
ncbi:MAG: hypothetical protein AAFY56_14850, partial [Pseudomonadota bacterium]